MTPKPKATPDTSSPPARSHCGHCGAQIAAALPALTAAAKLELIAALRAGHRAVYEALPEVGAITADDVAGKLGRDGTNVATSLKKLAVRGLVKREGSGAAHHPYRWSKT